MRAHCDVVDATAEEVATDTEWRSALADTLPVDAVAEQRGALLDLGVKVQLGELSVSIAFGTSKKDEFAIPARLVRRGSDLRLALPAGDEMNGEPHPVLLRLIAHARAAQKMVESGVPHPSVAHYGKRHFWQLLRIAWLAPDILAAIVDGRQPPDLTGRKLLRATNIPLDWAGQRKVLGCA
jgi:site-specific DNA recombinase